jgi:dTDP-4-dehydrorhamnose 3,5-epimerase
MVSTPLQLAGSPIGDRKGSMKIIATTIKDVRVIEPQVFEDPRGFFIETYQKARFKSAGIDADFVQDNLSFSGRNTIRGLHFQHPHGQAKLVQVLQGVVYDVAVDIRQGSPSFGEWTACRLSADNKRQMFIPAGFAHGFCVLSETALFHYKCSEYYRQASEHGVLWNDPELGIDWPIKVPILSPKDAAYPCLSHIDRNKLPRFED